MIWKPNRWIALTLGLFLSPSGMLYAGKAKWAIFYFLLSVFTVLIGFIFMEARKDTASFLGLLNLTIVAISSVHTFWVAKHYQEPSTRPWYSHWYGIILIFLAIGAPIFLVRSFLFEPFRLPSASMEPSYKRESQIIISKWGFGNYGTYGINVYRTTPSAQLHRGDAIVFSFPQDPSMDYFKRVIGVPGDTIEYRSKKLLINGRPVPLSNQSSVTRLDHFAKAHNYDLFTETFDAASWNIQNDRDIQGNEFTMTVPEKMYFVMGDNRDQSNDSRYWGYVPETAIKGKVIYSF